ncbi:MAG: nickel-dependent lactate racemase, partial [Candidatus Bathyarchaeia archaeon]
KERRAMVEVWFPYGSTEVPARIPVENYAGTLEAKKAAKVADARLAAQGALTNPLDAPPLRQLLSPDMPVVIQVNVADPYAPHELLLLPIIEELRAASVPDEKVKIIATAGVRPPLSLEEAKNRLGHALSSRFTVLRHDPMDSATLSLVGETRRGTRVYLNKDYLEAPIRVITGEVGFHSYALYTGGRESIAFDLSGISTLAQLHSLLPSGETGLGPMDTGTLCEEMTEIAGLAPPSFTLNLVRDVESNPVSFLAGDMARVLEEGIKVVEDLSSPAVPELVDIVVASPGGSPWDATLQAAVGAVENSLPVVRPGGIVVLVAECREGYGSNGFHEWLGRYRDFRAVVKAIRREWEFGAEEAYLLRHAMQTARVILVSALPELYAAETYGLRTAPTANAAIDLALRIAGRKAKVAAVPHAAVVRPRLTASKELGVTVPGP